MAVNETYADRRDAMPPIPPIETTLYRRPLFPAVRWGAVLAGVFVGISVQLVMTLLGIATGLMTTSLTEGETLGTGPVLWAGLSMLVAAFVGGYVAARMSGLKRKADGVLHGAVSWAVTTILFAVLATTIGGTLVSGVFSSMNQIASAAANSGANSPLTALMRSQGANMDADTMRQLQGYLANGQRNEAVTLIVGVTDMDEGRASAVVDQAMILSGSPNAASPQGRAAAENAMRAAGRTAWIIFGTVALALLIGIGGGMLGAAGARRVNWGAAPIEPAPAPR